MRHSLLIIFLAVLFAILLSVTIFVAAVVKSRPTYFAEKAATYFMDRPVSIRTATFAVGNPFNIELTGVRVANEAWGSQPDMIEIGNLRASIRPLSLVTGKLKFDWLFLNDVAVLLEHGPDGRGNWKKKNSPSLASPSQNERAKRSRENLSTMINLELHNSHIVFRTSSGARLKIDLDDLKLQTTDEDQPVLLTVTGAYNDIAVDMTVVTQSFAQLHNTNALFGADVNANGATTSVYLDARMMDPLNFDQVEGQLDVHVKNAGEMTGLFGDALSLNIPLNFKSVLKRDNDNWKLDDAEGDITGNKFQRSRLRLVEGKSKQPDNIDVALNFKAFDMKSVLGKSKKNKKFDDDVLSSLEIGENPSSLVNATIKSEELRYGNFRSTKLDLTASIQPNRVALDHVSMDIPDGQLSGSFASTSTKAGSKIKAAAQFSNLNNKQLFTWLGMDNKSIEGNSDLGAVMTANSKTFTELKQTIRGTVAVSMVGGRLSRHLVRLVSADVKALFDDTEPLADISCAIAVFRFINGIGSLAPFEVRTDAGTLFGTGEVNLPANSIDLKFQTDPDTTSLLALNLPVQISGPLESPTVSPASTGIKFEAQGGYVPLSFSQADFARRNPCYTPMR